MIKIKKDQKYHLKNIGEKEKQTTLKFGYVSENTLLSMPFHQWKRIPLFVAL